MRETARMYSRGVVTLSKSLICPQLAESAGESAQMVDAWEHVLDKMAMRSAAQLGTEIERLTGVTHG